MKTDSPAGFLDHLEILRRKLISIALFFFVCFGFSLFWLEPLIKILLEPLGNLPVKLIFIKPQEKFLSYIKVAFFAGLAGMLPFLIIQVGHFIFPALNKKEKKNFVIVLLSVFFLFIAGALFAYFILVPFMLNFFVNFAGGDTAEPFWSIGEYLGLLVLVIFVLAWVFEMPIVLWFLMKTGILPYEFIKKQRKLIIILIFLLAAIITPPDLYSQLLVGGILYALFELTLLLGRRFRQHK